MKSVMLTSLIIIFGISLLSACNPNNPTIPITPAITAIQLSNTAVPSATAAPPTVPATSTPVPSGTPVPVTNTPSPSATNTLAPTNTPAVLAALGEWLAIGPSFEMRFTIVEEEGVLWLRPASGKWNFGCSDYKYRYNFPFSSKGFMFGNGKGLQIKNNSFSETNGNWILIEGQVVAADKIIGQLAITQGNACGVPTVKWEATCSSCVPIETAKP